MNCLAELLKNDRPELSCEEAEDESSYMGRFFVALFQINPPTNEQGEEEFTKAA